MNVMLTFILRKSLVNLIDIVNFNILFVLDINELAEKLPMFQAI